MTDTPVIEAQLLRWSESHNGRTVTLQLPSDGEHPFRGLPCGPANGQRLALAVVLIDDNEETTPIEPPSTAPEKPKGGRLAQQAAIACTDRRFQRFLEEVFGVVADSADAAAEYVRSACGVKSRSELDNDSRAGLIWTDLYSRYIAWLNAP